MLHQSFLFIGIVKQTDAVIKNYKNLQYLKMFSDETLHVTV